MASRDRLFRCATGRIFCLLMPAVPLLLFLGCGGMNDDLLPSGTDKRPAVACGTTGYQVCQQAPDFTLFDTLGSSVTLSSQFSSGQGVVIYFTMWCPVCDVHMSHMRSTVMPQFSSMVFLVVDYVSGSIADARNEELSNGYGDSGFRVLADTHQAVLDLYGATMGSTVVIDGSGIVQMNEDYKNGARLQDVLGSLP